MKTSKEKGKGTGPDLESPWAREIAAELEDELGVLPVELAIRHLPAVPTVREVRTLLDGAKDEPLDYLILRLFYYTGVRISELAGFRFAHVSYDGGTILVIGGKGGKDRYVLVDPRTLELIRRRQGERPLSDPIVGLTVKRIAEVVKKYGVRAGLVQKYEGMGRSFSPHSLRHAFATHRYDAGMDLAALKQLLGHEFLSTTLIYVETSMRHLKKQYRKTDPMREK